MSGLNLFHPDIKPIWTKASSQVRSQMNAAVVYAYLADWLEYWRILLTKKN